MMRTPVMPRSQGTLPPGRGRRALEGDTPRPKLRIRVLIVEDNPADAELMIRALERSRFSPEWERVDTELEFTARLTPLPDLILSDYALPHFSGIQALQLVRSRGLNVPFILISGSIGEDIAVEAMRNGADDYLLKDRMARLGQSVRQALEKRKLRTEIQRAEKSYQESEERFRATFEQAGVGMALRGMDPRDSRWLRVNQKLCDILGYTQEELLQLTSLDITPPEDRALAIDYSEKLLTGEIASYSREKRYLRKDGRIIWTNITLTAVSGAGGQRSHVISVIEDITSRKEAEERVKRLSRVRAVLGGINAAIVRFQGRQKLFQESCRIVVDNGQFPFSWIGVLDPKTQDVTPVAWSGERGDELTTAKSSARDDSERGKGAVGRAIRERRAVINNDIAARQFGGPRVEEILRLGFRSQITLPLFEGKTVAGTLTIYATEKDFFDEEEFRLLTELAGNISFALDNIARQQKLERLSRVRALSGEINASIVRVHDREALLKDTCRVAMEHGKFKLIWIGTLDRAAMHVMPDAWAGFDDDYMRQLRVPVRDDGPGADGTTPRAVRTKQAAWDNDIAEKLESGHVRRYAIARGVRSAISLPLVIEGEIDGVISLYAAETGFFTDEEIRELEELASNVSLALERMAKQQKIEKLSRIRGVSSEINAAIARIRERGALLRDTCRIAADYGKFGFVWVARLDHENQRIQPVAWMGFAPETAHAVNWSSLSSPGVTLGEVIRTRRVAVRNDIESEASVGILRREAAKQGCRSTVCLPFVVEEKVAAAMILFASGRDFFVEDELLLLGEMASNISIALEQIARQEKIEKLSRIRAVSSGINAAIVRIREREALLQETCRIAAEHGKFEMAWIGSVDFEQQRIWPVAWTGFSSQVAHAVSWASISAAGGTLGEAVRTRRAAVRNDIETQLPVGGLRGEALKRGHQSTVCLPLVVDDKVSALVVIFAAGKGFFDEDELALLNEVAADVSFALQSIAQQEKVEYLSYYDTITGLPNRRLFIDRAGQQMRSRGGEPLMTALILLNLERFRIVNESLGRNGGDELLRLVARRLEHAFHGKDHLARIGADNFGLVVRGIRDTEAVAHIVQNQILGCFAEPFSLNGSELRVATKAGIAVHPTDGQDADAMFKNAEAALKRARVSGDRYLFYAADMNARAAQVLSLENSLRKAVEARQFVLHYQPKIRLADGRICGMEALIRWQEPGGGLVPPGTFIPLLEETGLVLPVGRWALGQALADYREWSARGYPVPRIAVNVSAIQLQQSDFADVVIGVVQEQGNNPGALEIEITESLLMKDVESSIRKLSILRRIGISVAMDDFGTGYSSLAYIARLPISSIKIDRAFITGMAGNPQDMSIVTTIIALAHSLNLKVVAEGVETLEQSKLLTLLKCDEAQGYLFGKPMPAADMAALLSAQTK